MFFKQHFKPTQGALVVPGAVVGSHCFKVFNSDVKINASEENIHQNIRSKNSNAIGGLISGSNLWQRYSNEFIHYQYSGWTPFLIFKEIDEINFENFWKLTIVTRL